MYNVHIGLVITKAKLKKSTYANLKTDLYLGMWLTKKKDGIPI